MSTRSVVAKVMIAKTFREGGNSACCFSTSALSVGNGDIASSSSCTLGEKSTCESVA